MRTLLPPAKRSAYIIMGNFFKLYIKQVRQHHHQQQQHLHHYRPSYPREPVG